MKLNRSLTLAGIGCAFVLISGCSNNGSLSKSDMDAIKNHSTTPMPANAAAMLADQQKKGADIYAQRMKEHGMTMGANGMRAGFGMPGQPAPAESGKK